MSKIQLRRFWSHQRECWEYCQETDHPALFVEMRLGKTLVAIRTLKGYPGRRRRFLIVGPSSALYSWIDELEREGIQNIFFLSPLSKRERMTSLFEFFQSANGDGWFIVNKEFFLSVPEIGDLDWDSVVCDESVWLRNPKTKVSKFFCDHFREVPHRLILTGLPNPESDMDWFQQFKFLHGSFMGEKSFWKWRHRNFRKITWSYDYIMHEGSARRMKESISSLSFVLRAKDVGRFTKRIREERDCAFPLQVRREYEETESTFVLPPGEDGESRSTKYKAALFQWLRMFADGIVDRKLRWSGKLDVLVELIREIPSPVVVWSCFNDSIRFIRERLDREGINSLSITGAVPVLVRKVHINRFQRGEIPVLILQVKCASYGMNLQRASASIYFDSPVSANERRQSESRIIGSEREDVPLFIDLVNIDTVDGHIIKLLMRKETQSIRALDVIRSIQESKGVRE